MLAKLAPALGALLAITAAGAALQLLLPAPLERSRLSRLGFSYLLGAAWLALAAWASSFCLGLRLAAPLFTVLTLAPIVAAVVVLAARGGRAGGWSSEPRTAATRGRWALVLSTAAVVAVTAALLADAAAGPVTDFDGRMTWGTVARYLRFDGLVLPEAVRDETYFVIHPRYPLVMPLTQVAVVELAGQSLESFSIRPIYALFYPALFLVAVPTWRRAGGIRAAAVVGLLLLCAPVLLWSREVGPRGTYSDFPLAAFLAGGAAILLHPRARHDAWRGVVSGLLLAAAAGCKNEGLVMAPAVSAWALAVAGSGPQRRTRVRAAATALAIVAVAVTLVIAWRSQIPNRNDEAYFESTRGADLVSGLADRAPAIAGGVLTETFDSEDWGSVFWFALPLLALGWRGLRSRGARFAAGLIGTQLALVTCAYAVVVDPGIIAVTWDRFLVQMLAPIGIVLAAATRATLVLSRFDRWRRGLWPIPARQLRVGSK